MKHTAGSTPDIGVIFDMDGVLVDSADAHWRSWRQLADECGATVTEAQFAATFGRQNRDIIPFVFGDMPDATCRRYADRKESIYRDLIRDDAPVVPGAVELVNRLYAAGAKLAVGSSAPRANIDLILDIMRVRDLISVVVSGDDVTRGKPDPQVFALCCRRLGLPPHQCVVIEDAPAGVEAAKAAGARAVAVLIHHPADAFARADMMVARLGDLTPAAVVSVVAGNGHRPNPVSGEADQS
ncbi:MAG: HAD family hydrolase [Phycisphaerae bacterium]